MMMAAEAAAAAATFKEMEWNEYWIRLSSLSLSLAPPFQIYIFHNMKSTIKWIEKAICVYTTYERIYLQSTTVVNFKNMICNHNVDSRRKICWLNILAINLFRRFQTKRNETKNEKKGGKNTSRSGKDANECEAIRMIFPARKSVWISRSQSEKEGIELFKVMYDGAVARLLFVVVVL